MGHASGPGGRPVQKGVQNAKASLSLSIIRFLLCIELYTRCDSPVGAGIAGSSALNIAVCGALAAWTRRELDDRFVDTLAGAVRRRMKHGEGLRDALAGTLRHQAPVVLQPAPQHGRSAFATGLLGLGILGLVGAGAFLAAQRILGRNPIEAIRQRTGTDETAPVWPGSPDELGATWTPEATIFAVRSPESTAIGWSERGSSSQRTCR